MTRTCKRIRATLQGARRPAWRPALGAQHHCRHPASKDFPFEAIDESWFASIEDAARALRSPAMQRVTESLARVSDPARNIAMLTRPTHRWPKAPRA
jgi:hypothetical protein